jgi:hypothetical protein
MPNNFLHIGLIQLLLPNAKIIDARRHPMGCCFSNFKQYYARGQGFSYSLSDMGRFYSDYVALMAHFDEVLPGRVHRVFYEQTVDNTETEVRRLLDYCGLAFEPACLTFFDNARPVRTASSEQVRRPVYRDSVDQWRHYEQWLDPLKAALGPVLDSYPVLTRADRRLDVAVERENDGGRSVEHGVFSERHELAGGARDEHSAELRARAERARQQLEHTGHLA